MNELVATETELNKAADAVKSVTILNHLKEPQNLITYLLFTAWCKFMGISSYIPSITVG